jgi:two-component system alkaline phosphatase synthesis response regulator PhoP
MIMEIKEKIEKYFDSISDLSEDQKKKFSNEIIQLLEEKSSKLSDGGIEINFDNFSCKIDDKVIEMPRKEFWLLAFFIKRKGKVFSRREILDSVWSKNHDNMNEIFVTDRTVDVHINKIREKLGKYKNRITTHKGFGYKFE